MGIEKQGSEFLTPDFDTTINNLEFDNLIPEKKDLTKESAEKLSHLETQLTSSSLKDLDVSRSYAFNFAKDVLHVSDPLNIEEFKELIKKYQREHGLEADGIIGKRTYMEMFTHRLIPIVESMTIINKPIYKMNSQTLDYIDFVNKHPFASSATNLEFSKKLAAYQKISGGKDIDFTNRVEASIQHGNIVLQNDPQTQKILNTKGSNGNTLYEDLRDNGLKDAISKHSGEIKLVALVAFVFGAFNNIPGIDKIPGAGSWYGRIALLIGGSYLGLDKGLEDLLTKGSELAGKGYEKAKEGINEGRKNYTKPEWVSNFSKNLSDTTGDLSKKIGESYESIVSNFDGENSKNKNTDKYVKDFDIVSEKINGNPKIMNKEIVELEKVSDIKSILSQAEQSELFPSSFTKEQTIQREKDLNNYIKLLLSKKREAGDLYVKDLLFSKSLVNDFMDKIAETNVGYTKNSKSNENIKTILGTIQDKKVKTDIIKIMMNVVGIEDGNDFDTKTKLEEYLKSNKIISENDKKKLEEIINVFESEVVYYIALDNINSIKLADGKNENDSLTSIDKKVSDLEKYKIDFDRNQKRLQTADNSGLVNVYNTKKMELYKKGKELEGENTGKYSNDLVSIEKNAELSKDEEIIKSIEKTIENYPTDKSKPQEFVNFYEKNYENTLKIDKLSEKYLSVENPRELKILEGLNSINKKYNNIKINYEKVKADYKAKIDEIRIKIDAIVINSDIDKDTLENHKKTLQGLLLDFETIKGDSIQSDNYIKDIEILWNKYVKNEIIITSSDNLFEIVDKKIGSNTEKPNLETIVSDIQIKVIDIESKFGVEINISSLDINNTVNVTNVVNDVLKSKKSIDSMISSDIKNQKELQLKGIVSELIKKYNEVINSEDDLSKMAQIKSQYDSLVYDKLSGIIDTNIVEKSYNEKLETIKRNEFIKQTVSDNKDIEKLIKDSGVIDFFAKYGILDTKDDYYNKEYKDKPKINTIIDLWSRVGNNTKLVDILDIFKNTIPLLVEDNETITNDSKDVYNNLNSNIDKALKGYIQSYLNTILNNN